MARTISAGKSPRIKVSVVGGDVSLVGWESSEILLKGDDDGVRLEQNGEEISLSCDGDLLLRVPKAASFEIAAIGGDASIRGVQGSIELKQIGGDLSIREAGSVTVDTIQADFSLRSAQGDLHVKNAQGDVSIRDVEGSVILDSVADDLALRGARGNVHVNVGEDVIVYLEPKAHGEYSITAGDDILLVLKPNANVTLTMHGDEIDVDWPGIENEDDVTERVLVLGDGSAKIALNAGGDIRVTNDAEAGNSAEDFGNFAGMNFDWSGFGDLIARQVERVTGHAARQAEATARRAAGLAEDVARRAGRHAERHARRWGGNVRVGRGNWDISPRGVPTPPTPPSEPVAEEERMAILKMLAEKKITAEQAEQLLNALEGGK